MDLLSLVTVSICALLCCQSGRVADSRYRLVISVPLGSKFVLWEE